VLYRRRPDLGTLTNRDSHVDNASARGKLNKETEHAKHASRSHSADTSGAISASKKVFALVVFMIVN
jgi:hypothetical protein